MFPIGDDDAQRRTFPIVTYALIALNVLMFSGGTQRRRAIRQRLGVYPETIFCRTCCVCGDHFHRHVHACQLVSPLWQHALSVDLRRQRRRPFWSCPILDLLSTCWSRCDTRPVCYGSAFEPTKPWGLGCDCRRARCLHPDVPPRARERPARPTDCRHASSHRDWTLDCFATLQWRWKHCPHPRNH